MRYVISGFAVLLLILIVVMAQQSNKSPLPSNPNDQVSTTDRAGDPKAAATEGLQTLRALVDDQNFRDLGFESRDEAATATLGEPIRVYLVRLDQLRDFQPEGDASKLLTDTSEIIFPVLSNGQARSSITLARTDGKWTSAAFGGASVIKQIAKVRSGLTPPQGGAAAFVKVPALNVYFVSQVGAGAELMLTPLTDQPDYRLKEGGTVSAREAFLALVPAAKAHDGKTS